MFPIAIQGYSERLGIGRVDRSVGHSPLVGFHLDKWFKPVHAPTTIADHVGLRCRCTENPCHGIRSD